MPSSATGTIQKPKGKRAPRNADYVPRRPKPKRGGGVGRPSVTVHEDGSKSRRPRRPMKPLKRQGS